MISLDLYNSLLEEIQTHLSKYDVKDWPLRIANWIGELKQLQQSGTDYERIAEHLRRTKRSLGGMGTIGDVFISPQAGHTISSDKAEIRKANRKLDQLLQALFDETTILLQRLGD